MPVIQPNVTSRRGVLQGSTFVVMVGDDPCTVRATGVCPIADVLAVPEAERLAREEMEAYGVIDAHDGAEGPRSSGGMIAAPRLKRRQRAVSSRAMFFAGPRD